jgi:hypothetical protein
MFDDQCNTIYIARCEIFPIVKHCSSFITYEIYNLIGKKCPGVRIQETLFHVACRHVLPAHNCQSIAASVLLAENILPVNSWQSRLLLLICSSKYTATSTLLVHSCQYTSIQMPVHQYSAANTPVLRCQYS